MTPKDNHDDVPNLDAIDKAIRDNERAERAKELGLGSFEIHEDCPLEIADEFVNHVHEYETAPIGTDLARLASIGIMMPDPDLLDDAALHTKLWEVIRALAGYDSYLHHTDHLSDRELYRDLWSDILREEKAMFPPGSGWINHIDMIGGGSDEDIEIGLRYYDTEEQRAHWARDFPSMHIPPHEPRPYDRDRLLPQPPEPRPPSAEDENDGEFDGEYVDDDDEV